MPVPAILAGLAAAGAAALGVGAQMSAKEKNELAQKIADESKKLYDNSKLSLEKAQGTAETSLLNLGNLKKQVLETSVKQFLTAYERIKNIELSESVGFDEIKNFTFEKQDVLQLREMSNIYQTALSSGTAGAATGAIIALAASGYLPFVTNTLSIAGAALSAGEIGMAASLAGSALFWGAAMTPLTAIAAPAVLFSGISTNLKADENLEKAQAMCAEAESTSEKMKTAEILCNAIADRADMLDDLLLELNKLFSCCTDNLDKVTTEKLASSIVYAYDDCIMYTSNGFLNMLSYTTGKKVTLTSGVVCRKAVDVGVIRHKVKYETIPAGFVRIGKWVYYYEDGRRDLPYRVAIDTPDKVKAVSNYRVLEDAERI